MDGVSAILLASTVFSLATSSLGFFNSASDLYRGSVIFPRKIKLLKHELEALQGVVEECYRTVHGVVEAPPHVKDLLYTTYGQGEEIDELAREAVEVVDRTAGLGRVMSRIKTVSFIVRSEKRLSSEIAVFRDKVGLLRDACSEYVI